MCDAVYAFGYRRPAEQVRIRTFAEGRAKVERVMLLGSDAPLRFVQAGEALQVTLPELGDAGRMMYGLKIQGSMPLGVDERGMRIGHAYAGPEPWLHV